MPTILQIIVIALTIDNHTPHPAYTAYIPYSARHSCEAALAMLDKAAFASLVRGKAKIVDVVASCAPGETYEA